MTQQYIGSKIVTAWPEERDGKKGYAVKYADGYTSWSPADVFEAAYLPLGVIEHKPAHQQRVIGEREQVNDRLVKLTAFFYTDTFNTLPDDERSLMYAQQAAMQDYVGVLDERIALFQDTPQG